MNLMDLGKSLLGGMLSNPGTQQALIQAVIKVVTQNNQGGGAAGITQLVQQFEKNGLGQIVSSWVSTGQNMPISAEQVQQGMGEQVQQIATAAGTTPQDASAQLANILPGLIDKLTPGGKIDPALINQAISFFTKKAA